MASGRLALLSDDEIARIHETSLKILQEIGLELTGAILYHRRRKRQN